MPATSMCLSAYARKKYMTLLMPQAFFPHTILIISYLCCGWWLHAGLNESLLLASCLCLKVQNPFGGSWQPSLVGTSAFCKEEQTVGILGRGLTWHPGNPPLLSLAQQDLTPTSSLPHVKYLCLPVQAGPPLSSHNSLGVPTASFESLAINTTLSRRAA